MSGARVRRRPHSWPTQSPRSYPQGVQDWLILEASSVSYGKTTSYLLAWLDPEARSPDFPAIAALRMWLELQCANEFCDSWLHDPITEGLNGTITSHPCVRPRGEAR